MCAYLPSGFHLYDGEFLQPAVVKFCVPSTVAFQFSFIYIVKPIVSKVWVLDKDNYLPTKTVGQKYEHIKSVITPLCTTTWASA
jgi:hypothetical protein